MVNKSGIGAYESNSDKQRELEAEIAVGAENKAFLRNESIRKMNTGVVDIDAPFRYNEAEVIERYTFLVDSFESGASTGIADLKGMADYMRMIDGPHFSNQIKYINKLIIGYGNRASL